MKNEKEVRKLTRSTDTAFAVEKHPIPKALPSRQNQIKLKNSLNRLLKAREN